MPMILAPGLPVGKQTNKTNPPKLTAGPYSCIAGLGLDKMEPFKTQFKHQIHYLVLKIVINHDFTIQKDLNGLFET